MSSSAITGATRILGVIADPVAQARSPSMANALLESSHRLGAFVMVPMHVGAADFVTFVGGLRGLQNFSGAIVSMPHKIAVAALVDELTPQAAEVGAVNVIRRAPDGQLVGTLLDGEGFVAGLGRAGHSVRGARVLLAGAGGAASAVAFAVARHGAVSLCILNRTPARAIALAARVAAAYPGLSVSTRAEAGEHFDIAINGTALGMRDDDALPLPSATVERCALVAECVLAPEHTRLLELAARLGKQTHTGIPMLEAQMELMLAFMGAGTPAKGG